MGSYLPRAIRSVKEKRSSKAAEWRLQRVSGDYANGLGQTLATIDWHQLRAAPQSATAALFCGLF
jgi:hypothetical protein